MTVKIDEAIEKKSKLQSDIGILVSNFTQETGLLVDRVDISSATAHLRGGGSEHFYGKVEVEVKLP